MRRKGILLFIVLSIMLVMLVTGTLYAFSGAIQVEERNWELVWGIRSNFYANRLSPSMVTSNQGNDFPLQANKHIKRARVKIWEEYIPTGQITQGPLYKYSAYASSSSDSTLYSTGWLYLWDTLAWENYRTRTGLYCWYF